MSASRSDRARLAAKLRELRAVTGRSGNQFAAHLGWPQSRVSKIETGAQLPTDQDVTDWLTAAGALDQRDTVAALLADARIEQVNFRKVVRESGGAGSLQRLAGSREQRAARVRTFLPAMIPGLMQTPAYARELLSLPSGPAILGGAMTDADLDRLVALRIERQTVLYEGGRSLAFVLGEAALWTRIGGLDTQRGQLDRLQAVAELGSVDLRIVPFTTATPVCPLHGFSIYDDETVTIEMITGSQALADPEEVTSYARLFGHLHTAALAGREATQLIQRVSRQLGE
ncbi:helix-turn-helix transcriptional regulator [Amycolatopsis sp. 195334CR]|uniref:helix-turn-helix domain-containing protein n=1 Tax=Amycolatopsis sp. 195334CR TaxID=2814588 RepID=UPI0027DD6454|nr:helix-turn-helix transcriptional regulator [Amycolatopsis sp. 195334CR]